MLPEAIGALRADRTPTHIIPVYVGDYRDYADPRENSQRQDYAIRMISTMGLGVLAKHRRIVQLSREITIVSADSALFSRIRRESGAHRIAPETHRHPACDRSDGAGYAPEHTKTEW